MRLSPHRTQNKMSVGWSGDARRIRGDAERVVGDELGRVDVAGGSCSDVRDGGSDVQC